MDYPNSRTITLDGIAFLVTTISFARFNCDRRWSNILTKPASFSVIFVSLWNTIFIFQMPKTSVVGVIWIFLVHTMKTHRALLLLLCFCQLITKYVVVYRLSMNGLIARLHSVAWMISSAFLWHLHSVYFISSLCRSISREFRRVLQSFSCPKHFIWPFQEHCFIRLFKSRLKWRSGHLHISVDLSRLLGTYDDKLFEVKNFEGFYLLILLGLSTCLKMLWFSLIGWVA